MNFFDDLISKQVMSKFNVQVTHFELIGAFDLSLLSGEQIHEMILSTDLKLDKIRQLPFRYMGEREVKLYLIDRNTLITVYDSSELWENSSLIDLYRIS